MLVCPMNRFWIIVIILAIGMPWYVAKAENNGAQHDPFGKNSKMNLRNTAGAVPFVVEN